MKDEGHRKLAKVLIPIIRKQVPSMMAKEILGVQPMTAPIGNIFNLATKYAAESWRKKFIWLPQRSIYGKLLFGLVNERGVWKEVQSEPSEVGSFTITTKYVLEYAANRELFKAKLEGRDE